MIFFNKSSNKKKRKIYQFKYESIVNYESTTMRNEFYGYLNPSQDYSIISINRLKEHGVDTDKYHFEKITSPNHLSRNKFSNIVGVTVVPISFEITASGLKNIRVNGATTTSSVNNRKVEMKVCNVLVLKESPVDFRLGNDFILESNTVIESKPRSNYNKGKFTHQLKFKDGVTVDLERIENKYDIYDEEEVNESSDEDFGNDDYIDENNIASHRNSKHKFYDKLNKYKIYRNFMTKLHSNVGFWNVTIIITLLIMISIISYSSYKTQSLVEELVIPSYNNQFTKPDIDDKLEDYVRKLKTTTSFLELFELDKRQNPKISKTPKTSKTSKISKISKASSSSSTASSASSSSTATTSTASSHLKEEEDRVGSEETRELYTNLVNYTEILDKTKRTLLDMYNHEVTYSFILQQNVDNLSKYLSVKKKRNIFRMIPFIGKREYFPLTKNFEDLVGKVINNTRSVMDEINTSLIYCERIINQVEKTKDELGSFIFNNSKSLTAWFKALVMKAKIVVNNLGEVDSETGLKCQKLLMALDNDLRELSSTFEDLRNGLLDHLFNLSEFLIHFKLTERITDLEIDVIKKHLVKLQDDRRIIFDKGSLKEDDVCPVPTPIFPIVRSNS